MVHDWSICILYIDLHVKNIHIECKKLFFSYEGLHLSLFRLRIKNKSQSPSDLSCPFKTTRKSSMILSASLSGSEHYIHLKFDPLGRPTVMSDSDHYFDTCPPYICPSNLFKTHAKITEGPVEWIIWWHKWWHLSCLVCFAGRTDVRIYKRRVWPSWSLLEWMWVGRVDQ